MVSQLHPLSRNHAPGRKAALSQLVGRDRGACPRRGLETGPGSRALVASKVGAPVRGSAVLPRGGWAPSAPPDRRPDRRTRRDPGRPERRPKHGSPEFEAQVVRASGPACRQRGRDRRVEAKQERLTGNRRRSPSPSWPRRGTDRPPRPEAARWPRPRRRGACRPWCQPRRGGRGQFRRIAALETDIAAGGRRISDLEGATAWPDAAAAQALRERSAGGRYGN